MEQQYLLTYEPNSYAWFGTENEMLEFIECNDVNVIDALYIDYAEEVIIDEEE